MSFYDVLKKDLSNAFWEHYDATEYLKNMPKVDKMHISTDWRVFYEEPKKSALECLQEALYENGRAKEEI